MILRITIASFLLAFTLFPITSYGANFCASGWGTEQVNGTWIETGTENGKAYYVKDGRYTRFPSNGNGWYLSAVLLSGDGETHYYYNNTYGATPVEADDSGGSFWNVYTGSNPVGGLVSGDCVEEEEELSTSTAATSTEAILGSIAFGQGIIIAIMSLGLIAFFYNSMTNKKPWS